MSARLIQEPGTAIDEEALKEAIAKAQARFDALSPEDQWLFKTAQRIRFIYSRLSDSSRTKESVAREVLVREVSEKFAIWVLQKSKFREFLYT